jgi:hypothetical protein
MYNTINQNLKQEYIHLKKYFWKNKQYILFNRSIFTGIITAILISSVASHLMRNLEYHLNTSFMIAVSYITYYSVFGLLYYHDNKEEYLVDNRKRDTKKFIRNILKIVFSVGIAELVYGLMRWSLHFYLLTIGYEPYLTSIIAHVFSAIVFAIMINLGVKATKLFNNRYDHEYSKI